MQKQMYFVIRDNRVISAGILAAGIQLLSTDQLEDYIVGC